MSILKHLQSLLFHFMFETYHNIQINKSSKTTKKKSSETKLRTKKKKKLFCKSR